MKNHVIKITNICFLLLLISGLYACSNEKQESLVKTTDTITDYDSTDSIILLSTTQKIQEIENFLKSRQYMMEAFGSVTCKIAFINYHQQISSRETKIDDMLFCEAISKSSLKTSAEQKLFTNNVVKIRGVTSVNDNMQATWQDTYETLNFNDYLNRYGTNPFLLTGYIINDDTISQSYCSVNEELYTLVVVLDPGLSSKNYQQEIKQMSGSDSLPTFTSVNLEFTFDSSFEIKTVVIKEKYKLSMPILGSFNCTSTLTQQYIYDNISCEEIEFFQTNN